MDHKTLIANIDPGERARLTATSNRAGLAHLALHWGAIAVTGALIAGGVWGWPALMLVHGVLIVFLFTLLHETLHRTPFASAWLNEAVAHVCGFLLFLGPEWFRAFHFAHHRHTNDPDRDPELAAPKPRTVRDYLIYASGLPFWLANLRGLAANAAGRADADFIPPRRRRRIIREARVMLALYAGLLAALFGGATALLWLWIVPILLGQPVLRLYLLAEHGRCPHVANMLENTRTTFTNRLVRGLAWNMPYHAEHHAFPGVPFHKLPALHGHMRAHLRATSPGYRAFHRDFIAHLDEGRAADA